MPEIPKSLPAPLQATTEFRVHSESGEIKVAIAEPVFSLWPSSSVRPQSTKGGKPLVVSNQQVSFAELAILDLLVSDGWEGRWIDNYPLPPTFRTQYWDKDLEKLPRAIANIEIPASVRTIYEAICNKAKDPRGGGAWDVIAWRGTEMVFIEAKRSGSTDRIRDAQIRWIEAALSIGIPAGCFLFCEWRGEVDTGAHPPTQTLRPSQPTSLNVPAQEIKPDRVQSTPKGKPKADSLHRRTIRSALKTQHGWDVESHTDGTVDVRATSISSATGTLVDEVQRAVENLGYSPTVKSIRGKDGARWIRVTTPETLAQEGRGRHKT